MILCGQCKYRVRELCICRKLSEANVYPPPVDESDMLIYSYNEGGGFWVGEKFGCVHGEQKIITAQTGS